MDIYVFEIGKYDSRSKLADLKIKKPKWRTETL
jgi:hypothetical protein